MVYTMPYMHKADNASKKTTKEREEAKLNQFNKEMGEKIKALKLPKNIKINTTNLDKEFAALADTDYGK
jgi:hypothetical protein